MKPNMKNGWFVAVAVILVLGLGSGKLFAQPAGPSSPSDDETMNQAAKADISLEQDPPPPSDDRPMNQKRAEELRKKVELIWMWKMTEELNLSEQEGAKLFPVLRTYEEKKRNLREENRRLVRELEKMIKDKAPQGDLKKTMHMLEENDRMLQQVEQEGFHEVEKILPVEKQARYIVFQAHFLREIHDLIQRARQKEVRPGRP
jgi:regulator of replication initiation timing